MTNEISTDDKHSTINAEGETPRNDEQFLIVGVGASAGGIQALKSFFQEVNAESGIAYVVILHMSPEHESKLAEILQLASSIPVRQVKKREKIRPNHVYVIPPNRNLEMIDGHVAPTAMIEIDERRSPVDLFFRTLAETTEDRAVSVVLSGTGADGSIGLKRIKEHGGVVFAQDPREAEYNDMPRNAIATGMVDYVLPVSQIPAKIISFQQHLGVLQNPVEKDPAKNDERALFEIFTQLRLKTGHDFSNYKRGTILRRIERRLGLRELTSLPAYAAYLQTHPDEVHSLMKDLLISVTNFFRDPDSIASLAATVLPKIIEGRNPIEPVRIWVSGCATGEEAYSIAILWAELVTPEGIPSDFQVFATDLDQAAIQVAREGFYNAAEVAEVSPARIRRFFTREQDGYRVRRELREKILFAVHNVIRDPPFSHVDLISCRNLLIYLNRSAQSRVLELFHFALNPSGYLFLGASESIDGASDLFTIADKEHHLYRSRPVAARVFPFRELSFRQPLAPMTDRQNTAAESRAIEQHSFAEIHQRLLEQYAPPSVVVNQEYEVVHLSEHAGRYLQIAGGEPSYNLLKIVHSDLRIELRTALYEAVRDGVNVDVCGRKILIDEDWKTVNLLIRPVLRRDIATRGFILVIFEETPQESFANRATNPAVPVQPLVDRLDEELRHLKNQLRDTVEQYEIQQEELRASNEELQATNEELRSAAEELETSKEELQSVNEELTTVNQEFKVKIEELSQANSNFQNLMNSTNIGTIFVNRDLRIRQFTPTAKQTFNLISSDLGRPLMDITSKFKNENLLEDIETALKNLQTVEREVTTVDGLALIMRISPYRTVEDRIDGAVITLVDVTERAQAEEAVRRAGEELEAKIAERTGELARTNENLITEINERKTSERSRMQLLKRLVSAQEDERRSLARELHDQLGQQLTSMRLKLESLKGMDQQQADVIVELQGLVRTLDDDVDFLAWRLRPIALDELGLAVALANYVKEWSVRFNIQVNVHVPGLKKLRLAPEVESNLYRVAQEALNNCAKHARCTETDVILECRAGEVLMVVEDNGVGFDADQDVDPARQMGLISMRERITLIGGRLELESSPGNGTTVLVKVPIAHGEIKL